jgi:hypothetical protein
VLLQFDRSRTISHRELRSLVHAATPDCAGVSVGIPSVADTHDAALAALRPGIAFYCEFFPHYNRMMAEHGFAIEAAAIADAWARGDARRPSVW